MAKRYTLTDEHRAQLKPWADKWIANAMSTKPMDDIDKEITRAAVIGMYRAAGLPPPKHIVFVPSPIVLRFASGFAAAVWHMRSDDATRDATSAATYDATSAATYAATSAATDAATDAATSDATRAATYAATYDATSAATSDATRAATRAATCDATSAATYAATSAATDAATDAATSDATRAATYAATRAATYDATCDATSAATRAATYDATYDATCAATSAATDAATYAATRAATRDATSAATRLNEWFFFSGDMSTLAKAIGVGLFGLKCAFNTNRMWQGGNQWSAWDSFLSFFKEIAGLKLSQYDAFEHWLAASRHSGPRVMHPKFCMISDRPRVLTVDDRNRPHAENGPFCAWSDGFALFAWHGVRVPAWIILHPDRITRETIERENNQEIRRVLIERYGYDRYMADAKIYSEDLFGKLRRKQSNGIAITVADVINGSAEPDGSHKRYVLCVPDEVRTCREAIAWTYGMPAATYKEAVRT